MELAKKRAEQEELERKKREDELHAIEEKKKEIELTERPTQLVSSADCINTFDKWVIGRIERNRELQGWRTFIACRNIPDFVQLNEVNAYLEYWRCQMEKPNMKTLLKLAPELLQVVEELKEFLQLPAQGCSINMVSELGLLYHDMIVYQQRYLDKCTYAILKDLSDLYDPEVGIFDYLLSIPQITHCLWGNMYQCPEYDGYNFQEVQFQFKIPEELVSIKGVYRLIKTEFDHYSDSCKSYFAPAVDNALKRCRRLFLNMEFKSYLYEQFEQVFTNIDQFSAITEWIRKSQPPLKKELAFPEEEASPEDVDKSESKVKKKKKDKKEKAEKKAKKSKSKGENDKGTAIESSSSTEDEADAEEKPEKVKKHQGKKVEQEQAEQTEETYIDAPPKETKEERRARRKKKADDEDEKKVEVKHSDESNNKGEKDHNEDGHDSDDDDKKKKRDSESDSDQEKTGDKGGIPGKKGADKNKKGGRDKKAGSNCKTKEKKGKKEKKVVPKERSKTEAELAKERERAEKAQFIPELHENELNLRQHHILGGTYSFELLDIPPQPVSRGKWTIHLKEFDTSLKSVIFKADFNPPPPVDLDGGAKKTPEEMEREAKRQEEELQKLVLGEVIVPKNVLWFEPPIPVRWDPVDRYWTKDGFYDIKFDERTLWMSFRTTSFGIFGLGHNRWLNLPYQTWELRPMGKNKVFFALTASMAVLEFIIYGDRICVSNIDNCTNAEDVRDAVLDKYMRPNDLIKTLRTHNLDVFPEIDSYAYVDGILVKNYETEDHLYQCMAIAATAFNFQWSRWNLLAGREKLIYQMRERHGTASPGNYQIVLNTPRKSVRIDCTEVSPSYSETQIEEFEYHADLLNLVGAIGTPEALSIISNTNPHHVETVRTILTYVRPLTFA